MKGRISLPRSYLVRRFSTPFMIMTYLYLQEKRAFDAMKDGSYLSSNRGRERNNLMDGGLKLELKII